MDWPWERLWTGFGRGCELALGEAVDWLWERLWTGFGRGCGLALGEVVDWLWERLWTCRKEDCRVVVMMMVMTMMIVPVTSDLLLRLRTSDDFRSMLHVYFFLYHFTSPHPSPPQSKHADATRNP